MTTYNPSEKLELIPFNIFFDKKIKTFSRWLTTLALILTLTTQRTTISGTSAKALDTLLLAKPYEHARYLAVKIPVSATGEFSYTFETDTALCQLIYKSEFDEGAWSALQSFTDGKNITFDVLPREQRQESPINGSEYTRDLRRFKESATQEWMPVFMSAMQKSEGLAEAEANAVRDSLVREFIGWQSLKLREMPAAIAYAVLYENVTTYADVAGVQDALKRQLADVSTRPFDPDLLSAIKSRLASNNNGLVGKRLYDFQLVADNDKDSTLLSKAVAEHRFTLLDLWAPWCGPCLRKSKKVLTNLGALTANDVNVIGIVGGVSSYDAYVKAKAQHAYPWPNYPEISARQDVWGRYGFGYAGGGQVLLDRGGSIVAINPSVEDILLITSLK